MSRVSSQTDEMRSNIVPQRTNKKMIHRDQEIGRRKKREQTQKTPCEPYAAHYQDEIFCVCDIREEKTQTQLPVILQGNGREMWCFPRADDFQWIVCCLLLLLLLYTPTYKPTRTHILEIDLKKERKKKGRDDTIQAYTHESGGLVSPFFPVMGTRGGL